MPYRSLSMALAILCAGCGATPESSVTVTDSAGVRIVESAAPAWSDGEGWRVGDVLLSIGALEGDEAYQLFRVRGAARLPDGGVMVVNGGTAEVRIYDAAGRFVRALGGQGEGPGEFRSIFWAQLIPPDTVLAQDLDPRQTMFRLDGELIGTSPVNSPVSSFPNVQARLPDGRALEYRTDNDPPGFEPGHVRYTGHAIAWDPRADSAEASVDTLLTAPAGEGFLQVLGGDGQYRAVRNAAVPFGAPQGMRAIGGGRVAMGDGSQYRIEVWAGDEGRLSIRRPVEPRPVTSAHVEAWLDDLLARYPEDRHAALRSDYAEIEPAATMPAYSEIQLDAGGNLWVERFRVPGASSPRTWDVFDRDGRWLGGVDLPEGLDVYEIGTDYVLGLERDDMDVEYVRVYEVDRDEG